MSINIPKTKIQVDLPKIAILKVNQILELRNLNPLHVGW